MKSNLPIKNKIIRQILSDIEIIAKKVAGRSLIKIILYGSIVRRMADKESDIDIMLLINDSEENIKRYDNEISKLAFYLSLKYNIVLSIMLKDYKQFNNYIDILPFYRNVQKMGIEIYGQQIKRVS